VTPLTQAEVCSILSYMGDHAAIAGPCPVDQSDARGQAADGALRLRLRRFDHVLSAPISFFERFYPDRGTCRRRHHRIADRDSAPLPEDGQANTLAVTCGSNIRQTRFLWRCTSGRSHSLEPQELPLNIKFTAATPDGQGPGLGRCCCTSCRRCRLRRRQRRSIASLKPRPSLARRVYRGRRQSKFW